MNVKQIIKDNSISGVYSLMHGINIPTSDLESFRNDGSYCYGGECLIFPSKEERNWDRFKPKEPVYKPCESVEQFADLFLGAKVKSKKDEVFYIIYTITGIYTPSFWFDNYTLLDGTPIGIKCDE